MKKEIEYTESSGNIFADLGVDAPDEMLAENYRGQFVISILSALVSVFAGLTLSYYFDIASGATIVLSSAFLFLLATVLRGRIIEIGLFEFTLAH